MKNFYLDFEFSKESGKTYQFIKELEELEESLIMDTDEGKLYPIIEESIANIYIDSVGGENKTTAILFNFLKNTKFNYNYIVTGDFSSNALLLLLALNPKNIKIMRQAGSIVHLSNYNHPVANLALNDNETSKNDYLEFKNYLNLLMDIYNNFLTKEELQIIKQGGDIYLSSSRIDETFKKLKKNKKFQKEAENIFELTL